MRISSDILSACVCVCYVRVSPAHRNRKQSANNRVTTDRR